MVCLCACKCALTYAVPTLANAMVNNPLANAMVTPSCGKPPPLWEQRTHGVWEVKPQHTYSAHTHPPTPR
eukprot:8632564-Alexandrium_andersonii.AAC.1